LDKELCGSQLKKALEVISESYNDIVEVTYVKGSNANFVKELKTPIVIRYKKNKDKHHLTVTYF
jgi:hypothetical protein